MNQQNKEAIVRALKEKKVSQPFPRCGSFNFQVIGQTIISMNESPKIISLGEAGVPAAVIVCSNCGFITLHALGSLGLMPKEMYD